MPNRLRKGDCWYCDNDQHACSSCGDPVGHDEAFCEGCYAIVFGEEDA